MSVQTMTLTDFLLARIAEDEAVAQAATPSPWIRHDQGWVDSHGEWIIVAPYHELDITDEDAEHVTRWQPARARAECEAKRRIVERYQREADVTARTPASGPKTPQEARSGALGEACLLLALPYADHPDYREEWRP